MLKTSESDFIQGDCRDRYRDKGVLQQGREIGLHSKYNKEKWELIARNYKGPGWWSVDGKLLRGNMAVGGDFG